MVGGGDSQLRTKLGKLIADVGIEEMVRSGVVCAPHDAPAVHRIKQELEVAPKIIEVILLGDLNVRLRETWDNREDKLATALAGSGLTDVTAHFTPRRRYRWTDNWTW